MKEDLENINHAVGRLVIEVTKKRNPRNRRDQNPIAIDTTRPLWTLYFKTDCYLLHGYSEWLLFCKKEYMYVHNTIIILIKVILSNFLKISYYRVVFFLLMLRVRGKKCKFMTELLNVFSLNRDIYLSNEKYTYS